MRMLFRVICQYSIDCTMRGQVTIVILQLYSVILDLFDNGRGASLTKFPTMYDLNFSFVQIKLFISTTRTFYLVQLYEKFRLCS
jgi:hypothetical protein